jgi:sugar O-acyltransferase (sialic acid O-acetyltransferase NeuD family)
MNKMIIVFGDNIIAEMLYLDAKKLGHEFQIESFCVDEKYLRGNSFCDKPLIGFQEVIKKYPPKDFDMISTVDAPSKLRNRLLVFDRLKKAGYTLRNYISPLADVCSDIVMGENNLIFPFVYVGSRGKMGNANLIRQHTYLGHDFHLGDGNTLASGCILGGFCQIGNSCFLGINSSVNGSTHIADETLIGSGSVVIKDTNLATTYVGNPARAISTHENDGIMINLLREQ